MDTVRTPHPLSVHRLADCGARNVPAAQRRQLRHGGEHGDDFRTGVADVPGYLYQYGDAALQNDGGRYGKRKAERTCLLYPKLPMQCRQPGGLPVPVRIRMGGHQQYGAAGSNSRLGNLLVLHRRSHSDILRYLYDGQGQGNAARRICRIPRHYGSAGTRENQYAETAGQGA